MRARLLLATALLLAPLTAGCLGLGEDDGGSDDELVSKARATASTGGLEGVVTDAAIQPVEGATVTLVGTGETTQTASDGSFAFSELAPDTYTLRVEGEGFQPTEQEVDIRSDSIARTDIVLSRLVTVQPYSQQLEFNGFVECSVRAGVGVAVCAIPNIVLGGNATNDRFLFTFPIEENPWQMVTEIEWDANQPAGTVLDLIVEPSGISNDNRTEFGEDLGESPLRVHTDRQRFAEVDRNTTRICEGEGDDPGPASPSRDAYCNHQYIDQGGEGQVRVFVSGPVGVTVPEQAPEVGGLTVRFGAAVQQDYRLVITSFYNAPACEDYSVFQDNVCEQQDRPPEPDPYDGGDDQGSTNDTRS